MDRFKPEDVLAVHFDTVNPARREIVRLGLHLRDARQGPLSETALKALAELELWLKAGASSDLRSAGAPLATRISTFFQFVATPLALKYGGGESGLAKFLKDAASRIKADPQARFEAEECRCIDKVLSDAWSAAGGSGRGERGAPVQTARAAAQSLRLGWFESLDGFGSLDPTQDLASAPIT